MKYSIFFQIKKAKNQKRIVSQVVYYLPCTLANHLASVNLSFVIWEYRMGVKVLNEKNVT